MSVREFAPAKVNLSLHVAAPRADGRHPLESIVAFADVGDWLWAEEADKPSLNLAGPFASELQSERNNLVIRAAQLLVAETGVRKGVRLTLEKNLPVASGLGGGSSDAAAALRALNKLWELNLSERDLIKLAAKLGADVPACVSMRACFMSGTGEQTAPLVLPPLYGVLVNPLVPASTATVYAAFDARGDGAKLSGKTPTGFANAEETLRTLAAMRNDLTDAAIAIAPQIARALAALAETGAQVVRLSGSGATVFALFTDLQDARRAALHIEINHPGWWAHSVRLAA